MTTTATDSVPPGYDAELTAKREDLRSLRACWREFLTHFSPRIVLSAVALGVAARFAVGEWSWRDLTLPVSVLALQPFAEWWIHKYLLHMPAFTFRGKRVESYGAIQHRRHHRHPSDLDRVLLAGVEVTAFLLQIAALSAAVMWGWAIVLGGHFLPLWIGYTVICWLGLFRYEWSHYLIHTPYIPKSDWYRRIWRNHRLHHFKHERYWLGVSSNLGDRVLGTDPDQRTVPRSRTARTLAAQGPGNAEHS